MTSHTQEGQENLNLIIILREIWGDNVMYTKAKNTIIKIEQLEDTRLPRR